MLERSSRLERRFQGIAETLRPFDLQFLEDEPPLSERELFGELYGVARSGRFLGYYSHAGVMKALEAYGLIAMLEARGLRDLQLELDVSDPVHHRLRVYAAGRQAPETLLIDLAIHLGSSRELKPDGLVPRAELLVIDWLTLQNPLLPHDLEDLLPGQRFQGLGIGLEIGALIGRIAHRLKLDGCLATPAWYHNAVFYSQRYRFVEPVMEGRFRAIQRDTRGLDVSDVSWAFELDCVLEDLTAPPVAERRGRAWAEVLKALRNHASIGAIREALSKALNQALRQPAPQPEVAGNPPQPLELVRWSGHQQVWALSPALEAYFEAPPWRGIRDAVRDGTRFQIDLEQLHRHRALSP